MSSTLARDNHIDIAPDDPPASTAVEAIHSGDAKLLERLLGENSNLVKATVDRERTLLHVATDWPGHFPNNTETVATLVAFGADVNAKFAGRHSETPLHWAASSNEVCCDRRSPQSWRRHRSARRSYRQWRAAR
jgi:hypothetical protein